MSNQKLISIHQFELQQSLHFSHQKEGLVDASSSKKSFVPIKNSQGIDMYYVSQTQHLQGNTFDSTEWSMKNFTILKEIGQGGFGKVYLAKINNPKYQHLRVALKVQNLGDKIIEQFAQLKRQVQIHSRLTHPNISKLYGIFWDQEQFVSILEYADSGNLYEQLQLTKKGFNQKQASSFIDQLVSALQYLHSKNIIHRDIKPENILLNNNWDVKLCDFGFATEIQDFRQTALGTLYYQSPELINKTKYDKSSEYWAVGVLAYELVNKYTPFEEMQITQLTRFEVEKNIVKNKYVMPDYFSDDLKDFVQKMIKPKPEERMSFEQARKHPWLRRYDQDL